MSIKEFIDEYNRINAEIKKNNAANAVFRKRAKEIEEHIKTYMREKNQAGLKYCGQAIVLENVEKQTQKPKKEKEACSIEFLAKLGVQNPKEVYDKLLSVQRNDPIDQEKIKIKKLSKVK